MRGMQFAGGTNPVGRDAVTAVVLAVTSAGLFSAVFALLAVASLVFMTRRMWGGTSRRSHRCARPSAIVDRFHSPVMTGGLRESSDDRAISHAPSENAGTATRCTVCLPQPGSRSELLGCPFARHAQPGLDMADELLRSARGAL